MLRLFNTLTRTKEEFKPLQSGQVGMYSCGPTVYDHTHIGHIRKYTNDDILRRTFEYVGYTVNHVMNVTDVGHLVSDADEGEDKLEKGARREGVSAWDIAKKYEQEFFSTLDQLRILKPVIICRATEHINDQIDLVSKLEQKGYTYRTSDGIYFDSSKFQRYADFAHLQVQDLEEGARVEVNTEKRNPTDFALWKFSPKGSQRDMEWDSPWGKGFPGWHIECSAMSMKYLGETFDVHTGGIDHISIHHTNEIAQSEAATGKQFVRYWFHSEFLLIDNGKMSKSLGNYFTLEDVVAKRFSPASLRYFMLQAHYRSKLNFTWAALEGAQNALNKLYDAVRELKNVTLSLPASPNRGESKSSSNEDAEEDGSTELTMTNLFEQRFQESLEDDLNTPQALAVVWELVKSNLSSSEKLASLLEFDRVLGLGLNSVTQIEIPDYIQELLDRRAEARTQKDFKTSDELRTQIEHEGYHVEDTQQGQHITKQ